MVNWDTSQVQGEVLRNATNMVTEKYCSNGNYNTGAQIVALVNSGSFGEKKKVGRPGAANSQF